MTSSNPTRNTPIRIAVIGAGHLGRFHSKLTSASPHFELLAVADPSEPARNALATEVSTKPVADYREIVGEIDAAVVATPTVTHHAIAGDLLGRGIHCLVEKPLTPTSSEASELVDLAQNSGLVLQVGHVERFNPALELAGDALRDPKFISATRTSGYTFRSTDIGAVLDIMIHDIDLALSIADSPVSDVSAMGVSVLGDHEDLATARITFQSGCVAQLTASRVSYDMQRTMQVFTPRSFAAIDFASRKTTVVSPRADLLQRRFNASELTAEQRDAIRTGFFEQLLVKTESDAPAVNAIELEHQEFATAIETGAVPRVTGAVARDAVAVAEEVLCQIEQHQWDQNGLAGPMATPQSPVLPTPSFEAASGQLRKAG